MTGGPEAERSVLTANQQYCRVYRLANVRRLPGSRDPAGSAAQPDDTVVCQWEPPHSRGESGGAR